MKFRPCIDLHGGRVKQIVGGTLTDSGAGLRTNFVSELDSADFAARYRRDGLAGGHIIQLGPGNEAAARRALAAWPGGMQLGGGVTAQNAGLWLAAGASHVIVTSWVFADGAFRRDRLEELLAAVGRAHLVLDLSCRKRDGKYWVVTDRWQKFTGLEVTPELLTALAGACAEYLIHAVDVEGCQAGIDPELTAILASSPIPTTYAGGVGSLADIDCIRRAGRGRVDFTIGSALDIFGGKLSYEQIKGICC